ncbi:MAG TPA: arginine deiminase family protein [Saprospiraceae bacterium]|jgi:arginine deiminase|nr:arginine deiminase family protein [Saprospiraceae bacterium]
MDIRVTSEIGQLTKVMVHSPDGGIGNVPTSKLHDWLYDDIVDVYKIQDEYSRFQILLLLFLDTKVLFGADGKFVLRKEDKKTVVKPNELKLFENNPEKQNYFVNEENIDEASVLDTQFLLQYLFSKYKQESIMLIESICSIEGVHDYRKKDLQAIIYEAHKVKKSNPKRSRKLCIDAVKTLLTGKLEYQLKNGELIDLTEKDVCLTGEDAKSKAEDARFIFPPVPNFIFTRDICVTIGNHLLITKPKFYIRKREVVLMRFIAENYLCYDKNNEKMRKKQERIIDVSEDDDFFQLEEKDQPERKVNYEGGDIMMISNRHLLIGCSERTSHYAIQKLVNRIFWENIETDEENEIDIISVIKISEKRSQMHIDTVLSHVREDVWIIHSPLSEVWQNEQEKKLWYENRYIDDLTQKSENEKLKEKDVTIFQFYLGKEGKEIKYDYDSATDEKAKKDFKSKFKKIDFLLRADRANANQYVNKESCPYTHSPNGLHDLLEQISKKEFGQESVKFILSGAGDPPHDGREQWTDACNLLILKSGVAVGYDRNYRTAKHFNEKMRGDKVSNYPNFIATIVDANEARFKNTKNTDNKDMALKHILHVEDLIDFILDKNLDLDETEKLIESIENTLILLPSNELSRARGGSHCMTMPLYRNPPKTAK